VTSAEREAPAPRPSARLSKADRRTQLLDAAADLAVERGFDAVTMEGVAARAGVSKALPYQHFDNSDELIGALFEREEAILDERVFGAIAAEHELADKIRVGVHAYFGTVQDRGLLHTVLLQPGFGPGRWREIQQARARQAVGFFSALFRREFGFEKRTATIAASTVLTAVQGALTTWVHGHTERAEVERVLVQLIVGGLQSLAASEAAH
jgi:AcrR family transcriptional regulator